MPSLNNHSDRRECTTTAQIALRFNGRNHLSLILMAHFL